MPEGQRHLTHAERCQIHATGKSGLSGAAERGVVGPGRDDAGAVARGRGEAGGGLEPRADLRAFQEGGRADGGPAVDPASRPRRPEGGRPALAASVAPGVLKIIGSL